MLLCVDLDLVLAGSSSCPLLLSASATCFCSCSWPCFFLLVRKFRLKRRIDLVLEGASPRWDNDDDDRGVVASTPPLSPGCGVPDDGTGDSSSPLYSGRPSEGLLLPSASLLDRNRPDDMINVCAQRRGGAPVPASADPSLTKEEWGT